MMTHFEMPTNTNISHVAIGVNKRQKVEAEDFTAPYGFSLSSLASSYRQHVKLSEVQKLKSRMYTDKVNNKFRRKREDFLQRGTIKIDSQLP